ncbi:DUF2059 domain-containing protein [Vibrio cyclitrophicus]|uniref:DUF2059 domain-containing protein n=1 Tax=Vibrio cyclitrophicus TaxID=47951 RepID=UPI000C831477|nr:DUF2059 domain-containing protein [Vibrio cyclitrophicus]PME12842.1 hypothetical protein BCV43_18895 [Vibrio cyclitrophicus]PME73094.1 hypothetical protein BCV31_13265 [Vibrio cyclitrophicus]PME74036.1 hypothetical protein BCV29_19640 [Vibrio cyclitrophicus]PMF44899.1 hypothetical protein BCV14_17790 [Vibrio cyclitrophicus]
MKIKRVTMSKVIYVCVLFFSSIIYASEQPLTEEKYNNIIKLIEMTGSIDLGLQMSQTMTSQLVVIVSKNNPDIPKEKFEIIERTVNSVVEEQLRGKNGFFKMMTPIYHKYYTNQEIEELIAFYETSLGKKSIKIMPNIVQESFSIGQAWGKRVAPIAIKEVKKQFEKEGFTLLL